MDRTVVLVIIGKISLLIFAEDFFVIEVIKKFENKLSELIIRRTKKFVQSIIGKIFLSVIFLGPIMFMPTVWQAWTAENIDVLRTGTV